MLGLNGNVTELTLAVTSRHKTKTYAMLWPWNNSWRSPQLEEYIESDGKHYLSLVTVRL